MINKKKAQTNVAAIILIVIVLVILIALLILVLVNPSFISGTGSVVKTNQIVCNSPYILVGTECCLDQNHNGICDKDEASTSTTTNNPTVVTTNPAVITTPVSCSYPYMADGKGGCCLDQNHNGICDEYENNYQYGYPINYNNGYNQVYNSPYNNGYNYPDNYQHATIDDPFHISNFAVYGDYLELQIRNQGDRDYIITSLNADQCGSRSVNTTIPQGQEKTFNINCDGTLTTINSDLEVTYTDIYGNNSQTAEGNLMGNAIPVDQNGNNNYCIHYDSNGHCDSYSN